jgi:RTX calcium-binding nonapeptide repeat (4 copies)
VPAIIRSFPSRLLIVAVGVAVATVGLTISREDRAGATPVNSTPATYNACDRVFPDPQAYWPSASPAPNQSPFAKGQAACQANDYISYAEMVAGNNFLELLFPQFVEFYTLEDDFGDGTDCASTAADNDDYCSAGLARFGAPSPQRQKSDLYLLRITDERVPDTDKKLFAYPLSLHGIERAGVEGGTRAAEDLATWGWCQAQAAGENPEGPTGSAAGASVDCAREGAIPHPILETQPDTSLNAGDVLKQSVQYFLYVNADGWRRGDPDNVPRGFTRYNGNSVDLNRDWPTMGYTFRPYTPWSEPESKAFGEVLEGIRDEWAGGIDLHGQLIDEAFSFTLMGAGQHDYAKNQRILQTVKGAWEDAESRLGWHPLIIPNDAPQTCFVDAGVVESCDGIYGVQWGTVWDTIDYTITGGIGDWINSPLGLNGDGIDNEMSLSHLGNCGTGTCYLKDAEQLHVDGNKSLIYAMANYSLLPEDTTFRAPGKVGYVFDPHRLSHKGSPTAPNPYAGLPQQGNVSGLLNVTNEWKLEFTVEGPNEGVYNGGLEAVATPNNLGGFDFSTTPNTTATVLEQQHSLGQEEEPGVGPAEDNGCGEDGDQWVERNRYFNAGQLYFQSGQAVRANYPTPGLWRVCMTGGIPDQFATTGGNVDVDVRFLAEQGWPDPGQLPYDVSNMDFFTELKPFMEKDQLVRVDVEDVLRTNKKKLNLNQFRSLVIADSALPGHYEQSATVPAEWERADPVPPGTRPQKEIDRWGDILEQYVRQGGNLVLTDGAIKNLAYMGVVPRDKIDEIEEYAGNIGFTADGGDTDTYEDPLAKDIDQPGAAEGNGHRHQTYEPVPIGFEIQDPAGDDNDDAPVWTVDQPTWEGAGGRTVGTTTETEVTLGELPLGAGTVRIIGALLPMPSDQADIPYGLSSYALTYSGYQVFNNALQVPDAPGGDVLSGCNRLLKLNNINKIFGTKGKDVLKGTAQADAICGGPGKDTIRGLQGNDILIGGKANDRVTGSSGNDKIYLGAGNDRANGGSGKDRIVGYKGNDVLVGGSQRDSLNGQAGTDTCRGSGDRVKRCEN